MTLYAKYLKEREDFEIVESDLGFATFKMFGDECYIRDIYVIPSHRRTAVASNMANEISELAKSRGCKFLTGSVAPQANNSTQSIQVLLSYGFKLLKSDTNIISFIKELH